MKDRLSYKDNNKRMIVLYFQQTSLKGNSWE